MSEEQERTDQERTERRLERLTRWVEAHGFHVTQPVVYGNLCRGYDYAITTGLLSSRGLSAAHALLAAVAMSDGLPCGNGPSWERTLRDAVKYAGNPWRAK